MPVVPALIVGADGPLFGPGAAGTAGQTLHRTANGWQWGDGTELQVTATHIQWRQSGGTWANLVALSEITGPQGEQGATGDAGADG